MSKNYLPTFDVSKKGLANILARRGVEFIVLELIQNALDENSSRVEVEFIPVPNKRGLYRLTVEDDNPEGFKNIANVYTLFGESPKASDPTKAGRYMMGEKLVIANCQEASVLTTTGHVLFNEKGRRHGRKRRDFGSIFTGTLRMTKAQAECIRAAVSTVIVREDAKLIFNGIQMPYWEPETTFQGTLTTEKADEEGRIRRTRRKTNIEVYNVQDGDTPMLYEIGLPVVEIDCPYHINVCQRVPLNVERDNVTPAYMREILTLVLNEIHQELDEEDAKAPWIDEALESGNVTNEALGDVITARYGDKVVLQDPKDREAEKIAVSKGYTVMPNSMPSATRKAIKTSGHVLPAGQVTPSPKAWSDDPNASPADYIPYEKWSPGMKRVAVYATRLARLLMDVTLNVSYVRVPNNFQACYGRGTHTGDLTFNLRYQKKAWFDEAYDNIEELDSLLIHEFGHHYSSDHLSGRYHNALCDLGAKLKKLALAGKLREPTKKLQVRS